MRPNAWLDLRARLASRGYCIFPASARLPINIALHPQPGEGEAAVLRAFPSATVLRPAVMFGPGDAFLTPLLLMLRRLPVFRMFGDGGTRVQPACVEDIGEA